MDIIGAWRLITWKRYDGAGNTSYPFGEKPRGLLVYTADGSMMVQMVTADRPRLDTSDALGGSEAERAQAYSSCLAYFGRYRVEGDQVVHQLEGCLFPNWSDTEQQRPFTFENGVLSLRVFDAEGLLTNEILWQR